MTAIDSGIDTLAPVEGLAVTLADGVLSVTIDRPDSLNSLTLPVFEGLADAMEQAANDARVKVVRLGGAGRGFCSGAGMSAEDVAGAGPGGQPGGAGDHRAAASGRRGGSGSGGRYRRLDRVGLRPRISFG
jgi:enoyl-CoA hydratase